MGDSGSDGADRSTVTRTSLIPIEQRQTFDAVDTPKIIGSVTSKTDKASVRRQLAFILIGILIGTVILGFLGYGFAIPLGMSVPDFRSFFEVIFTAVVTLVSTVVGFYFGSQSAQSDGRTGSKDEA